MSNPAFPGPLTTRSLSGDILSGFLVFLIALPLCLAISMASGFPAVGGVMTAIIGGMLSTFLGSSRLTIKGPAAGLIVIALGAVTELGAGDPVDGYRKALAVGVVAALIQIAFALVRAASLGVAMSPSVVHGMLAAIGVIIISKQSHLVLGVKPEAKSPFGLLAEIPHSIVHANPEVALIGLISLGILFALPMIKLSWLKKVPAPLIVLLVAVPLGMLFDLDHTHTYSFVNHNFEVGPQYLVQLPGSLLSAVTRPDFSQVFSPISLKYILMFALVGSIESTLSVLAVDSMDPERRASNLNKDLLAVGVGNLLASLVGGLPMISEIVRSKANIDAKAQSAWSNFFHGLFLLLFVSLVPGLLHRIPLAALAAMLVYTGFRLASPNEFRHAAEIGKDQLALFLTTLLVTLGTDLLVGVSVGLLLKIALHAWRGVGVKGLTKPRVEVELEGDAMRISLPDAAVFTTLLKVRKIIEERPIDVRIVVLDLTEARLVDHTFIGSLKSMAADWKETEMFFDGLEELRGTSDHPLASRRRAS